MKREVKEVRKFKVAKQSLPAHPRLGKALKPGQNHFCSRLLRDMVVGHHAMLALSLSVPQVRCSRSWPCWAAGPCPMRTGVESTAGGTVVSRFWWELQWLPMSTCLNVFLYCAGEIGYIYLVFQQLQTQLQWAQFLFLHAGWTQNIFTNPSLSQTIIKTLAYKRKSLFALDQVLLPSHLLLDLYILT